MSTAVKTRDHEVIRQWAEERDGHPAIVRTKGKGGVLRIDFGEPEESLEPIDWAEFFEIFDEAGIDFLYQEEIGGQKSRFFKFVTG